MHAIVASLIVLALATNGVACDSGWQYIGRSLWLPGSAIEDPNNPHTVLLGTLWQWDIPESGGVYRHVDPDTTWEYYGLVGYRMHRLVTFPHYRRNQIYAATNYGLYQYEGDTSWTAVATIGTPLQEYLDFAISVQDTSLWVVAAWEPLSGGLYVSRDSGDNWYPYSYDIVYGNLIFSRYHSNTLYYNGGYLYRTQFDDSVTQQIWPSGSIDIMGMAYHLSQPWIYVAALNALCRYDEITGDTFSVAIPESIDHAYQITYVPDEGLVAGTSSGLFHVSDDLLNWTPSEDSISTAGLALLYVSPYRCVATDIAQRIFSVPRETAVSPRAPSRGNLEVAAFPNPANSVISLRAPVSGTVEVYDILGRRVLSGSNEGPRFSTSFDLTYLSSGAYFYRFYPEFHYHSVIAGTFRVTK